MFCHAPTWIAKMVKFLQKFLAANNNLSTSRTAERQSCSRSKVREHEIIPVSLHQIFDGSSILRWQLLNTKRFGSGKPCKKQFTTIWKVFYFLAYFNVLLEVSTCLGSNNPGLFKFAWFRPNKTEFSTNLGSTFRGKSCGENPDRDLQKSKNFSIRNFEDYIENIKTRAFGSLSNSSPNWNVRHISQLWGFKQGLLNLQKKGSNLGD